MQTDSGNSQGRNFLHNTLHFALVSTVYVIFVYPVLGSPSIFPMHDNLHYQMPSFLYVSSSLLYGYGVPLWDPAYGGIPIGATPLSLFPFVRTLGSLFYIALPLDAITIYKISLVVWTLSIACGWWLFLHRLCASRIGATVGTLIVLFGGVGITIFHQEQILATLFWLPWILLALFQMKKDVRFIIVVAALAGFSMTIHYPQIQLITFLFIGLVLLLTRNVGWDFLKGVMRRWRLVSLSFIVFVLAASPSIYLSAVKDDFSSPLRRSYEIDINSFDAYMQLNKVQISSAPFRYLKNYVMPESQVFIDQFVAYVTFTGLLLAFLGMLLSPKKGFPILILLVLFVWASVGINGYLPQLLYITRFPFIGIFRQWYHFMPLVNLCFSALGALGFSALISKVHGFGGKRAVLVTATAAVAIVAMYLDGRNYFSEYSENKLPHLRYRVEKLSEDEFFRFLSSGHFASNVSAFKFGLKSFPSPHLVYREWYEFSSWCPDSMIDRPFFSGAVYNDVDVPIARREELMKEFCGRGILDAAVLASIPAFRDESQTVQMPGIVDLGNGSMPVQGLPRSAGLYVFSDEQYNFTPSGANLHGVAPMNGMVVFPFCYGNGLKALLNGREVRTYPINGGAFTGVAVQRGEIRISLIVPFSWYQASLIIQAALLLFVVVFSLVSYRRLGGKHSPLQTE